MASRSNADPEDKGRSRKRNSPAAIPEYVYLYYIDRREAVHRLARHPHSDVQVFMARHDTGKPLDHGRIVELVGMADAGDLPVLGYAMIDLTLRHRAYLAFAWQESGRSLVKVEFLFKDDHRKTNHSFKNFSKPAKTREISTIFCINERLDQYGNKLGSKSEQFDVEFTTDPLLMRTDNEVTTNTGP